MVTIDWTRRARLARRRSSCPTARSRSTRRRWSLHYGQAIFEGLKAYRQPDGSIATFRPDANARRFQRSAAPAGDGRAARGAVPRVARGARRRRTGTGCRPTRTKSLYLRPFMIATEVGPRRAAVQRPTCTCSSPRPPAPYFPRGLKPVTVWLSRTTPGRHPAAPARPSAPATTRPRSSPRPQAAAQGCDQVVWLDAAEHRWVEEMGGMNLYFVYGSGDDARIVTPALTGTLLPGVTRDSLLTLGRRPRLRRRGGQDLDRRVARGQRLRRDHRGVRLRHRRGDHPGRRGEGADRRVDGRRRHRPARSRSGCARRCSTSRPARAPTRTAGSTRCTCPAERLCRVPQWGRAQHGDH